MADDWGPLRYTDKKVQGVVKTRLFVTPEQWLILQMTPTQHFISINECAPATLVTTEGVWETSVPMVYDTETFIEDGKSSTKLVWTEIKKRSASLKEAGFLHVSSSNPLFNKFISDEGLIQDDVYRTCFGDSIVYTGMECEVGNEHSSTYSAVVTSLRGDGLVNVLWTSGPEEGTEEVVGI